MTRVLCELELIIKKVKVSTTPDGKVMDLFFVTDTRLCVLSIYTVLKLCCVLLLITIRINLNYFE